MAEQEELVSTRIEERPAGRVAWVTVSNPARRNALGIAGKQRIAEAFLQLAGDDTLRVGVLTGGFSDRELRDAGAAVVFESIAELRRRLEETPLAD